VRSGQNDVCSGLKQGWLRRLSIGLVLLVFLGSSGRGLGAESLEARFLREAPAAWARYAELVRELQGVYSFDFSQTYRRARARRQQELKKNKNAKLLTITSESGSDTDNKGAATQVYGVNPNYAFKLRQNASGSWAITVLVDLRGKQPLSAFEDQFTGFEHGAIQLVRLRNETLLEMVRKPEFKVVRSRRVPDIPDELVEVTFDYAHAVDERQPGNPVQRGVLVLDAGRDWCLRSYEVQTTDKGSMKLRALELNDTPLGISVPKRTLLENDFILDDERGENRQTFRYEFDLKALSKLPDDREFTLSAFGLPEPREAAWRAKSVPLYVWIALCGGVFLLLGIALRRRQKRFTVGGAKGVS
jgi:hypothetical protein